MRIRIEAPSSPFSEERLRSGAARLSSLGHDVDLASARPRGRHAYLNGSDDERASSLADALASDVDAIWLARGGYGLTRILHAVPAKAPHPTVVGFSDATALLCHLHARAPGGGLLVHGPLVTTLAAEPPESIDHLERVLRREPSALDGLVTLNGAVDVDGFVFAANLCVLGHLIGTASLPNLSGAILILEDVGERPYRLDRMLTQLLSSGALSGVRAVIAGDFLQCEEPVGSGARDAAPDAIGVLLERLGDRMPVLRGAPIGHGARNHAVPLGAPARLVGGAQARLDLGTPAAS